MICCNTLAKDSLQTFDKLRGEGYLGQQKQHIATASNNIGYKLHINLGLTRARNASQQMGSYACLLRRANIIDDTLLSHRGGGQNKGAIVERAIASRAVERLEVACTTHSKQQRSIVRQLITRHYPLATSKQRKHIAKQCSTTWSTSLDTGNLLSEQGLIAPTLR